MLHIYYMSIVRYIKCSSKANCILIFTLLRNHRRMPLIISIIAIIGRQRIPIRLTAKPPISQLQMYILRYRIRPCIIFNAICGISAQDIGIGAASTEPDGDRIVISGDLAFSAVLGVLENGLALEAVFHFDVEA